MGNFLSTIERTRQILQEIENSLGQNMQSSNSESSMDIDPEILHFENEMIMPRIVNSNNAVSQENSTLEPEKPTNPPPSSRSLSGNDVGLQDCLFETFNQEGLLKCFVMSEVLGKPLALRKRR